MIMQNHPELLHYLFFLENQESLTIHRNVSAKILYRNAIYKSSIINFEAAVNILRFAKISLIFCFVTQSFVLKQTNIYRALNSPVYIGFHSTIAMMVS